MGFQVKSGMFPGVIGPNWSQYATYFHLDLILGHYLEYMPVICRKYWGNLPFTGFLQEVYLLYSTVVPKTLLNETVTGEHIYDSSIWDCT